MKEVSLDHTTFRESWPYPTQPCPSPISSIGKEVRLHQSEGGPHVESRLAVGLSMDAFDQPHDTPP